MRHASRRGTAGGQWPVERSAEFLRLLGDPTRTTILLLLRKYPAGLTVREIADAVGITHSATSHQLGLLESFELVAGVREGQAVRYSLTNSRQATTAIRIIAAALRT